MTEKNKKYVLREEVRNTVELWITEVDEDGKLIRRVAEFLDYDSANKYIEILNKDD